jgi:hypothetical protein
MMGMYGTVYYTSTYKATGLKVNVTNNKDTNYPYRVDVTASIDYLYGTYGDSKYGQTQKTTGMSMKHIYIYLVDDSGNIYFPENSYYVSKTGNHIHDVTPLYVHLTEDDIKDVKVYFNVKPGTYTLCFLNGDGDKHWDKLFNL